jgi:hypothetical protein
MANMGYCRFQNTDGDLEDCQDALSDGEELSDEEESARNRLIDRCIEIAIDHGHLIDREVTEI